MSAIHLLWLNVQQSNHRLHAILNSNKEADIILVQEPWFDPINTRQSNTDPAGTPVLGTVVNLLWETLLPRTPPDQQCKVAAFRRIASNHFSITNCIDLTSNYHMLTLDIHTDHETLRVYNIYHDTCTEDKKDNLSQSSHTTCLKSLKDILAIDTDPRVPTIIGGDVNTHSRAWSPSGIRQSAWALDIEKWATSQMLELANPPGEPTRWESKNQKDSTLDLIWTNEAAKLDNSFQGLQIDYTASLGSNHAGIWVTHHLATATTTTQDDPRPPYTIQDGAHADWMDRFKTNLLLPPLSTDKDSIDTEADRLSKRIESVSKDTF
jgi:exonuclease III